MKTVAAPRQPALNRRQSLPALIHFQYTDNQARSVCLAGTFNDWNPGATPMSSNGSGFWTKDLPLRPGTYEYAFVVDGNWKLDPSCSESIGNPFGGSNSVLRVPAAASRR